MARDAQSRILDAIELIVQAAKVLKLDVAAGNALKKIATERLRSAIRQMRRRPPRRK